MIILLARFQRTSNAEYYSKRNVVEIVHAFINPHTERQGIIESSRIFKERETEPQHGSCCRGVTTSNTNCFFMKTF